ncbi:MAG: Asp-tRNA(Asn)/Glu-tRNA(Gln) amidotransferase subunit GatC [Nitrospira sp.]|nr:Asp-tRNA(Asn)/Glu-tRNA(Gln) amidotransferase subunit GatC [Nitrospira sp.]
MTIDKAEVEKVAKLARLEITATEQAAFSQQLSGILTYVAKLSTLKTDGVEAAAAGATNVFREDTARPSQPVEQVLANAPESANGFFVVPRIINEQ